MAMMIKRKYNLAGIKVSLVPGRGSATIILELEVTEEHTPHTVQKWEIEASEFGLPERIDPEKTLGSGYPFTLPDRVRNELRASVLALRRRVTEMPNAFWLHLVKPYGVLGTVPWETMLYDVVGVAILRLPDALADPPVELPETLNAVICASCPVADGPLHLDYWLFLCCRFLIRGPRPRVRVDVFTDLACTNAFRARAAAEGFTAEQLVIHDPRAAERYGIPARSSAVKRVSEPQNPWLLWMRDKLQGRTVDLVHFGCHGYMSGSDAAIAFAESPTLNQDRLWSRFVSADEIDMFLNQVGAWSVGFESLEGNYSQMGLRAVADELAQRRPGPVLLHERKFDDENCTELRNALQFLFDPNPSVPPRARSVSLCCQPFRVEGYERRQEMRGTTFGFRSGPARVPIDPKGEVPLWAAAAQRYVEQKSFEVKQLQRTATAQKLTRTGVEAEGMESAISDIQEAIARLCAKGGGEQ